ncbi:hypothetical protein NDU88_001556 [Pleurodeles waltl]|uniref:Uncharacterized protein n=1 Tax=Pleurodeles waltl TaxID=8319 RepID=A0AAV7VBT3_PLEWA|nr:hypothetical protein NDU88_001556 [Pleurodeles waltl]
MILGSPPTAREGARTLRTPLVPGLRALVRSSLAKGIGWGKNEQTDPGVACLLKLRHAAGVVHSLATAPVTSSGAVLARHFCSPYGLLVVRTLRGPLLAAVKDCTDNRRYRRGIPLSNTPRQCCCRSARHGPANPDWRFHRERQLEGMADQVVNIVAPTRVEIQQDGTIPVVTPGSTDGSKGMMVPGVETLPVDT